MNEPERKKAVENFDIAALGRTQTRGEDIRPPAARQNTAPEDSDVKKTGYEMPPIATLMLLWSIARVWETE